MNKELEALQEIREQLIYYKQYAKEKLPTKALQIDEECEEELDIIEISLKALELLKKNLVIAFEEDNGIDLPALVVGIKTDKNKLCVIYSTQNKEEIRILKEVLL